MSTKTKIKLSFLIEVEYEPNSEWYPTGTTIEEMLAVDLQGAKEDPYLGMERDDAKWTITGEVV